MQNFKSVNGVNHFDPNNALIDHSFISSSADYYQQESAFIKNENKAFIKSRGGFIDLTDAEKSEANRKAFIERELDLIASGSMSLF